MLSLSDKTSRIEAKKEGCKLAWNMQDYPASWKNFDELQRKKIIDIANALLASGYEEDTAIPIATAQGKEWYDNASDEELKAFEEEPNPQKDDQHDTDSANPDLLDEDVEVFYEDELWKVKSVKAERASDTFELKEDAVERAQEIAANKETNVITYTKDGKRQTNG